MTQRKILITSALPYANGPIHLGHLLEYIQTDIWSRFQKSRGHQCYYVCADDAHGTPIMLKAQQLGLTPEQMIAQTSVEHQADFKDFLIGFDNYHSTHSEENRVFASEIYQKLDAGGYINAKPTASCLIRKNKCSCRTVLLKAIARNAELWIKTAIVVTPVARLTVRLS